MNLITCKNLSLGYGNRVVVENLSFTVGAGDFLCVVGENSAGKSTLVKTLLGLQKPLRGEIIFDTSAGVGYLSQQTLIQSDFPASVEEIVLSGRLTPKKFFYTADDKEISAQNMELLNILPLAKKCFRELSGGQQRRVLLARALCAASKILILDEPVANLDPHATADFYEVISELNLRGVTIIMISHDVDTAIPHATHVLKLGTEIFFGKREDFCNA